MTKTKQRLRQLFIVCLFTGLFYSSSAQAVTFMYICDIAGSGTKDKGIKEPKVIVTLDEVGGTFTGNEYKLPDLSRREMMATALAALSNGLQLEIYTTDKGALPVITEIHLVNAP